jgi:hypothetical protein
MKFIYDLLFYLKLRDGFTIACPKAFVKVNRFIFLTISEHNAHQKLYIDKDAETLLKDNHIAYRLNYYTQSITFSLENDMVMFVLVFGGNVLNDNLTEQKNNV